MMPQIEPSHTIGDIVAAYPQTAEIFSRFKIDFCCGGNRKLSEALKEAALPPEDVVYALVHACSMPYMRVMAADPDWRRASYSELIGHTIGHHHAFVRREMPRMVEYAETVASVHGSSHPELHEIRRLIRTVKTELDGHLLTEEQQLFPLVLQYESTRSEETRALAIEQFHLIEAEHKKVGDSLKLLRLLTNDYAVPDDACPSYFQLYDLLRKLESELFQHIHLENNILLPRLVAGAN